MTYIPGRAVGCPAGFIGPSAPVRLRPPVLDRFSRGGSIAGQCDGLQIRRPRVRILPAPPQAPVAQRNQSAGLRTRMSGVRISPGVPKHAPVAELDQQEPSKLWHARSSRAGGMTTGDIVQQAEHPTDNRAIPVQIRVSPPNRVRGCCIAANAASCRGEDRGFESLHPRQY